MALAYTAAGTRDGDPVPYRAVIGSTYVHRDGGWQLAFHLQTPLDDAAA